MTKEELQEAYESKSWSEFADDEIYGILDSIEDRDDDYKVDRLIKTRIHSLENDIEEFSRYNEYEGKLIKAVEELESLLKV